MKPSSKDGGSNSGDALEEFGYQQELPRVLKLWTNWALGFAFISPVVGLYTVVGLGTQTAGPSWVLALPIVIVGQFLVALVYTQLAEKWPIAGGIYQWSRRLIGAKYGWWAGWLYLWALILTLSTVAYSAGHFLGVLVGLDNPSAVQRVILALIMTACFTLVNSIGLNLLKWVLNVGIACELVATVGIGIALISLFREQPVSVLWNTDIAPDGATTLSAFIAALAIAGWVILGFDACGSLAEETRSPKRDVPRAIVYAIVTVGMVDALGAAAIILATPDLSLVMAGGVADPVSSAVESALGSWAAKPFLIVVVTGFTACGIAVQGTGVRVLYSFARDRMVPLSSLWSRVSSRSHSPGYATLAVGILSAAAFLYANALSVLVSFATAAYYVGFLAPVVGVLYARLRRQWTTEGRWTLGGFGTTINVLATIWLTFELINISWPRYTDLPWWQNWAVVIGFALFVSVGLIYFLSTRPDRRFTSESATMTSAKVESGAVEVPEPGRGAASKDPHGDHEREKLND